MEADRYFQEKLNEVLEEIDPDTLAYDESEYWMIQADYEYIEYFAYKNKLLYTSVALPLARGLHDGDHRKSTLMKDDITYRLPYVIHPLVVCKMLIDIHIPLPPKELDILLAASLCHDMIEDIPFLNHGKELMLMYHLPRQVYDTVRLVTKRKDFTPEEEQAHFDAIAGNKLAALIKLSDRSNNVEDLYNRSFWKVHEYVSETNKFFMSIVEKATKNFPDIAESLAVLRDKIFNLTKAAENLVDRFDRQERILKEEISDLQKENKRLREIWHASWKTEIPGGYNKPHEADKGIARARKPELKLHETGTAYLPKRKNDEIYEYIEQFASARGLFNTKRALPIAKLLLDGMIRKSQEFDKEGVLKLTYYEHCLSATALLIDLRLPISDDEMDILLASTICHDMLGHDILPKQGQELIDDFHLDPRVYDIVRVITRPYQLSDSEKTAFYDGIRKNKLAVLLALADRGDQVEQLYGLSVDEALDYVREIKIYCFPMCFRALEQYPDVIVPINVLMGKIRNLIEITDIISRRYREREWAYNNEKLSLLEANARIRGLIETL